MTSKAKSSPAFFREVTSQEVREMAARMRLALPIRADVRLVKMKSVVYVGFASRVGRKATIHYRSGLTNNEFLDVLIHEWAHLHSGDLGHGNKWGRSYAAAYRAFHDLNCT